MNNKWLIALLVSPVVVVPFAFLLLVSLFVTMLASGTGSTIQSGTGAIVEQDKDDDCDYSPPPSDGQVGVVTANVKAAGPGQARRAFGNALSTAPDFVALQEFAGMSSQQIEGAAPGYSAWKDPRVPNGTKASRQAASTAVMWRQDRWKMLRSGRHVLVKHGPHPKGWDEQKSATWVVLEDSAGSRVAFISVHHMVNPGKYGPNKPLRQRLYAQGMDRLVALAADLAREQPVFIGGDWNSHKNQSNEYWSAANKMTAAGYSMVNHSVDHIYYQSTAKLAMQKSGPMESDHDWVAARFSWSGASAPPSTSDVTTTAAGCNPCPPTPDTDRSGTWPDGTPAGSDAAIKATYDLLLSAGFTQQDARLMTVIAGGESDWDPSARSGSSSATGLFQVLQSHDPSADLTDPVVNVQWAKRLFDASGNADPWQAWPESPLSYPPWVSMETHRVIEASFNKDKARVEKVLGGSPIPPGECQGPDAPGGVSGPLLNRLRQRAEMVIALSKKYPGGPGCVPGFNDQGVFPCGGGWGAACTAISMMIYGKDYVGSGDGGERAFGSEVNGPQGDSWPPPPGAIVSWPYSGSGHVSIYLGDGKWVDNWPDVANQTHDRVENGATAHWLMPPASFEGTFLNNGI